YSLDLGKELRPVIGAQVLVELEASLQPARAVAIDQGRAQVAGDHQILGLPGQDLGGEGVHVAPRGSGAVGGRQLGDLGAQLLVVVIAPSRRSGRRGALNRRRPTGHGVQDRAHGSSFSVMRRLCAARRTETWRAGEPAAATRLREAPAFARARPDRTATRRAHRRAEGAGTCGRWAVRAAPARTAGRRAASRTPPVRAGSRPAGETTARARRRRTGRSRRPPAGSATTTASLRPSSCAGARRASTGARRPAV